MNPNHQYELLANKNIDEQVFAHTENQLKAFVKTVPSETQEATANNLNKRGFHNLLDFLDNSKKTIISKAGRVGEWVNENKLYTMIGAGAVMAAAGALGNQISDFSDETVLMGVGGLAAMLVGGGSLVAKEMRNGVKNGLFSGVSSSQNEKFEQEAIKKFLKEKIPHEEVKDMSLAQQKQKFKDLLKEHGGIDMQKDYESRKHEAAEKIKTRSRIKAFLKLVAGAAVVIPVLTSINTLGLTPGILEATAFGGLVNPAEDPKWMVEGAMHLGIVAKWLPGMALIMSQIKADEEEYYKVIKETFSQDFSQKNELQSEVDAREEKKAVIEEEPTEEVNRIMLDIIKEKGLEDLLESRLKKVSEPAQNNTAAYKKVADGLASNDDFVDARNDLNERSLMRPSQGVL